MVNNMPDRIVLQPLAGRKVYFEAEVVRAVSGRDRVRMLKGFPHICIKPVAINGRSLLQEPGGTEAMHLWVALPTALIELTETCAQAMGVRGFGTVLLYQRKDGSLAYGLGHIWDLEIQGGLDKSWQALTESQPRHLPLPKPRSTIPRQSAVSLEDTEVHSWQVFFGPKVQLTHRKIVIYRHRSDDIHHQAYCRVLSGAWDTLRAGQLPKATEMNTVYYLMGQWPIRQAPRHLREAYP